MKMTKAELKKENERLRLENISLKCMLSRLGQDIVVLGQHAMADVEKLSGGPSHERK